MILTDRVTNILNKTLYICEEDCNYGGINNISKKVICECSRKLTSSKKSSSNSSSLSLFKDIHSNLKSKLNYKVLSCYELFYDSKNIIYNYGFYILIIIIASFIILIIINCLTCNEKLKLICSKIIDARKNYLISLNKNKRINNLNNEKNNKRMSLNNNIKKRKSKNLNTKIIEAPPKKVPKNNQTNNLFFIIKQEKKKKKSIIIDKNNNNLEEQNNQSSMRKYKLKDNNIINNINSINNQNNNIANNNNINNSNNNNVNNNINNTNNIINNTNKDKLDNLNYNDNSNGNNINRNNNINFNNNIHNIINNNINIKKKKNIRLRKRNFQRNNELLISNNSNYNQSDTKIISNKENIVLELNNNNIELEEKTNFIDVFINIFDKDYVNKLFFEEEMNQMKFKYALKMDKRNFITYYFSLLKQKQLIMFTFFVNNDYNIYLMKISLFLCVFSLHLMTNTFFFNDDNMHKIYEDCGKYNLLYQIPQILYSTIISSVITIILKSLSLPQKSIIKIKQENKLDLMIKAFISFVNCFKNKIILFSGFGLILLLFNLYYISLFCAVYKNTQSHLLTDTFTSFGISLLYPFGLSIIPVFLRIPALKSGKKDKKIIYVISQLISII